ncbi:MAG: hypothetical protein EKK61_05660 [Rickettsiales bacterium]|nr:MAG: hypothetical protein EKK61_05660 [Rickettsiales bacterium]
MSKIVTIKIGTVIDSFDYGPCEVMEINELYVNLKYSFGFSCTTFSSKDEMKLSRVKSIDGILVEEIDEVRIEGINDTVELKVGDIICYRWGFIDDEHFAIRYFTDDGWVDVNDSYRELSISTKWYVNGKLYPADKIRLPNNKENEMIEKKELTIADFHEDMRVKYRGVEGFVASIWKGSERIGVLFNEDVSYHSFTDKRTEWFFGGDCDEPLSALEIITEPKETTQDADEFEPITKDNIIEVLAKNKPSYKTKLININSSIVIQDISRNVITIDFGVPNWLQVIEALIGKKLKPLPKFYFKEYLMENGFKNIHGTLSKNTICLSPCKNKVGILDGFDSAKWVEPIKENADILIKMAELAEKLK